MDSIDKAPISTNAVMEIKPVQEVVAQASSSTAAAPVESMDRTLIMCTCTGRHGGTRAAAVVWENCVHRVLHTVRSIERKRGDKFQDQWEAVVL
ncbi:hypothetical protein LWI29_012755 [Acer saccharum]|uniref:Uncharacterized protein n=1 Tax=Acer saccharum TaxID=4024 RepID=A0AA39VI41_ACESA|nr:hypothetical protein LWI29_012755 [Acer saccharum]